MKIKFILSTFSLFIVAIASAVSYKSAETDAYIAKYKQTAIEQMKQYKIPASITLAQGILESGSGRSDLAVKANNHFGIKCTSDYKGKTYHKKDDKRRDCFRVYENAAQSFVDHSIFLQRAHYAPLFKLKITDYKGWANGLKKCGYATNPKYPSLLIEVIEQNKLYVYDDANYQDDSKKNDGGNKDKVVPNDDKGRRNSREEVNPEKDRKADNVDIRKGDNRVEINGVRCVQIKSGDTFYSLSKKYDMTVDKLKTLNDFPSNYTLKVGEYVFLKRKRRSYRALDYHIVEPGETMHSISQYYGVQLEQLKKHNKKISGEPKVGTRVLLH